MNKSKRQQVFDTDWQKFYLSALDQFDSYLRYPAGGIEPTKRDKKRLNKLFDLLQKGY